MSQIWLLLKGPVGHAAAVEVVTRLYGGISTADTKIRVNHPSHDAQQSAEMGVQAAYRILRAEGYLTRSILVRYTLQSPPPNIVGQSGGMAFALAFVTQALTRQSFRPLAATGILQSNGGIDEVDGIVEKLGIALQVLPAGGQFLYPHANDSELSSELRQRAADQGVQLIPVNRLDEALSCLGIELKKIYLESPFRGLEAFQFDDAGIFFGRNEEVETVCERLKGRAAEGNSSVLVVGASGSGKSSLVQAGVLQALVKGSALPANIRVRWGIFRPRDALMGQGQDEEHAGREELQWLAEAVCTSWCQPHGLDCETQRLPALDTGWDADGLVEWLLGALTELPVYDSAVKYRFIWVVDQVEELFTLGFSPESIEAFCEFLGLLAQHGIWLLLTLRSDFYDRYQKQPALVECFKDHGIYDLLPPGSEAVEQMITGPAMVADLEFELDARNVSLAARLREDAGKEIGVLPMLEFTLTELFAHRNKVGNILTYQAYEDMSGFQGAIGRRAESVYEGLTEEAQKALPGVVRALVMLTEGDEKEVTSRPASLSLFVENSPKRELVDAFAEARLLVMGGQKKDQWVRLAHEALLTGWPRAISLTKENKQLIIIRSRIEPAVGAWREANHEQKSELLLTGRRLSEAVEMLDILGDEVEDSADYIRESVRAEENRVREKQNYIKRIKYGTIVMALIAMFSTYLGILAWDKKTEAIKSLHTIRSMQEEDVVDLLANDQLEQALFKVKELNNIGDISQSLKNIVAHRYAYVRTPKEQISALPSTALFSWEESVYLKHIGSITKLSNNVGKYYLITEGGLVVYVREDGYIAKWDINDSNKKEIINDPASSSSGLLILSHINFSPGERLMYVCGNNISSNSGRTMWQGCKLYDLKDSHVFSYAEQRIACEAFLFERKDDHSQHYLSITDEIPEFQQEWRAVTDDVRNKFEQERFVVGSDECFVEIPEASFENVFEKSFEEVEGSRDVYEIQPVKIVGENKFWKKVNSERLAQVFKETTLYQGMPFEEVVDTPISSLFINKMFKQIGIMDELKECDPRVNDKTTMHNMELFWDKDKLIFPEKAPLVSLDCDLRPAFIDYEAAFNGAVWGDGYIYLTTSRIIKNEHYDEGYWQADIAFWHSKSVEEKIDNAIVTHRRRVDDNVKGYTLSDMGWYDTYEAILEDYPFLVKLDAAPDYITWEHYSPVSGGYYVGNMSGGAYSDWVICNRAALHKINADICLVFSGLSKIKVSSDNKWIYIGSGSIYENAEIQLVDLESDLSITKLSYREPFHAAPEQIAFSPDAELFAYTSSTGRVDVYSLDSDKKYGLSMKLWVPGIQGRVDLYSESEEDRARAITRIRFIDERSLLIVLNDGGLIVVDPSDGFRKWEMNYSLKKKIQFIYFNDDRTIACLVSDGEIMFIDLGTGVPITLPWHYSVNGTPAVYFKDSNEFIVEIGANRYIRSTGKTIPELWDLVVSDDITSIH